MLTLLEQSRQGDNREDDPIQLPQDTLTRLVELELANAERLTRIEQRLNRSLKGSGGR